MNSQEFPIRTIITPAEIRELLQPVLAEHPEITAAYLFGSVATGRHHSGSDIDIAILLARTLDPHGRKFLLDLLYPLLCRALRADIHLLFLDDASCFLPGAGAGFQEGRNSLCAGPASTCRVPDEKHGHDRRFHPLRHDDPKGFKEPDGECPWLTRIFLLAAKLARRMR